jgi:uncharacterized protein YegL
MGGQSGRVSFDRSESPRVRLTYLMFDISGSTCRAGWIDACNRAMPHLVGSLEAATSLGVPQLLCVATYNASSEIRLPLGDVRHVTQLPALTSSGFSSLSSAMSLLSVELSADMAQLQADDVTFHPPTVVVVADGLPTDESDSLLANRRRLDEISPYAPCLHAVHGAKEDTLAFKGLGFNRVLHAKHQSAPDQLAESIIDALGCGVGCAGVT